MAYNKTHKKRCTRKTNRLWDETQNTWAVPTKVAGVLALLAAVAITFAALHHSVDALNDEIAKAEQLQESLEQDLYRETLAWNRMKTPRNLIATLRNNGIAMSATPHGRRIAMGGYSNPAGRGAFRAPTAVAANL